MNCEAVRQQLVLQSYGELGAEQQTELDLHLDSCTACEAEAEAMQMFAELMADEKVAEVSPNLLAASRMKLDEALDVAARGSWWMRVRASLVGTWQHLYAAPALATLLVGAGFLGGNLLTRYQVAHAPKPQAPMILSNDAEGVIGSVSGIVQTPDPDVVQVQYTRIVPTTFQGRIDEPQVRQLLMMSAQHGVDNSLRVQSVGLLAKECKAGHRCERGGGEGLRDALLVSLRYDRNATVRLKALEGLQPYIGQDEQVRDAVLESLMRDTSAEVRMHAIDMLQPVEADSSVRQVLHTVSTRDENPYIRNASMQALGSVDGIQ